MVSVMDLFFQDLGNAVLTRWKHENFSLEKFPGIAEEELRKCPPAERVDLQKFLRGFLLDDAQPSQTESGFGEPEIIVYENARFYIQLLFWMDGTTAIHQHEFSGAFHVMSGSSIHAQFKFENETAITPHFRVGDLRMSDISLLETGCTVPIVSGRACIHSLFHLDTPSITVVVRTQHDPGTGPQFNYLPPHVAYDPVFSDPLTLRRRQVLDLLEQAEDPAYVDLVLEMVGEWTSSAVFTRCKTAWTTCGIWVHGRVFIPLFKKNTERSPLVSNPLWTSADCGMASRQCGVVFQTPSIDFFWHCS